MESTGYAVQIERYLAKSDEYRFHDALSFFHPIQYCYIGLFVQQMQPAQETGNTLLWVPLPYALNHMYAQTQAWAVRLLMQKPALVSTF